MSENTSVYLVLALLGLPACGDTAPEPADDVPVDFVAVEEEAPASLAALEEATRVDVAFSEGAVTRRIEDPERIAALAAALGEDDALGAAPDCLPMVRMKFLVDEDTLGEVALCDTTLDSGVVRVVLGDEARGAVVADAGPFAALLREEE